VASLGVAKVATRVTSDVPIALRASTGPDPASLYRAALDRFMAGGTDEAAQGFRDFVKRYPHHTLADNAQYWLGEVYYKRQDYQQAAVEFRSVVRRWPSENKVPDALLKLGYCLLALGRTDEGRAVLQQVTEHYPSTPPAQYAAKRLAELPQERKK
jgi:tol-pal system protein YbgF